MTSFREIDLRKTFDSEEIRELRRKHAAESNRKLKIETREMLMNTNYILCWERGVWRYDRNKH